MSVLHLLLALHYLGLSYFDCFSFLEVWNQSSQCRKTGIQTQVWNPTVAETSLANLTDNVHRTILFELVVGEAPLREKKSTFGWNLSSLCFNFLQECPFSRFETIHFGFQVTGWNPTSFVTGHPSKPTTVPSKHVVTGAAQLPEGTSVHAHIFLYFWIRGVQGAAARFPSQVFF